MIDTIDDRRDSYDIGDRLFANSCSCGAETAQNDDLCPACRIEHEALLERTWPRVVSWDATCCFCQQPHNVQNCPHIWRALRSESTCSSCGDPAVADMCHVCRDAGEPRTLALLAA